MAPYGACKSYKAKFEEGVVFLCFCVFVFLCYCVFVCVYFCVFEQTLPGCSEMAFQRRCV